MDDQPADNFGPRLRELRELKGFSQEELARRSGVSRVTVANAERGAAVPHQTTRNKLAKALDAAEGDLPEVSARGTRSTGSADRLLLPKRMTRLRKQIKKRGDEWGIQEIERRLLNEPRAGERWALEATGRRLRRKLDRKRGKYRGARLSYLKDMVADEMFDLAWVGPAAYSIADRLRGENRASDDELDELEESLDAIQEELLAIGAEVEDAQREIDERRARQSLGDG